LKTTALIHRLFQIIVFMQIVCKIFIYGQNDLINQ